MKKGVLQVSRKKVGIVLLGCYIEDLKEIGKVRKSLCYKHNERWKKTLATSIPKSGRDHVFRLLHRRLQLDREIRGKLLCYKYNERYEKGIATSIPKGSRDRVLSCYIEGFC
ncbi:hypothetical protein [Candidatus Neptunochlamydia vexilliferae]|uniref:Transposase n=1 Tax=Candidatus Neptunichlamydia vexilliferae TaxID=1651774 RepID=A0ABS0B148_9BACT|nr:hypothetical protein [Candidatus Neptunochlamydia vexilliferae]MBF5060118.1 hypothetical protein [Candidatus Neptunochlamydia vexilliferae]